MRRGLREYVSWSLDRETVAVEGSFWPAELELAWKLTAQRQSRLMGLTVRLSKARLGILTSHRGRRSCFIVPKTEGV